METVVRAQKTLMEIRIKKYVLLEHGGSDLLHIRTAASSLHVKGNTKEFSISRQLVTHCIVRVVFFFCCSIISTRCVVKEYVSLVSFIKR